MSDFKFDDIIVDDEGKNNNKKSKLPIILGVVAVVILAVVVYVVYGILNTQKEISNLAKNEQALIESDILEDENFIPEDTLEGVVADSGTTNVALSAQDSILPKAEDTSLISSKVDAKNNSHIKKDIIQSVADNNINYKYYILVNSFRGFYYAKKQVNLLKKYGYSAFYKQINVRKGKNKGKWYKVYAGPFNNFTDAKKASNYIKQKQNQKKIFIIKKKV